MQISALNAHASHAESTRFIAGIRGLLYLMGVCAVVSMTQIFLTRTFSFCENMY